MMHVLWTLTLLIRTPANYAELSSIGHRDQFGKDVTLSIENALISQGMKKKQQILWFSDHKQTDLIFHPFTSNHWLLNWYSYNHMILSPLPKVNKCNHESNSITIVSLCLISGITVPVAWSRKGTWGSNVKKKKCPTQNKSILIKHDVTSQRINHSVEMTHLKRHLRLHMITVCEWDERPAWVVTDKPHGPSWDQSREPRSRDADFIWQAADCCHPKGVDYF